MTDVIAVYMSFAVLFAVILLMTTDLTLQEWRFGHRDHHDDQH